MKFLFVILLSILVFAGFAQSPRYDRLKSFEKSHQPFDPKSLEARFEADVTQGIAPLSVQFTDQSTGNPVSWKWGFGDGDTSLLQHPSHEYNSTGNFTIKLTISDGTSAYTLEKKDYIRVTQNAINCDTLRFPLPEPLTYYFIPNQGYVSGNNSYGDEAICDYFNSGQPDFAVTGVIFDLSIAKRTISSTEKIQVCIWSQDGLEGKPGELLYSDSVQLSNLVDDVANQRLTVIDFNNPIQLEGPFFMGIFLPKISGDTVAFWSTGSGKVTLNTAWILTKDQGWQSAQTLWTPQGSPAFMISNAIYPKICRVSGITDKSTQIPFAIWPNPARDRITIVNQDGMGQVLKYSIFDTFGRKILQDNITGLPTLNIDVSLLISGMYVIQFYGDHSSFSTRLLIR